MIDAIKDYLSPKGFSILAYVPLIVQFQLGLVFTAVTVHLGNGEMAKFVCAVDTNVTTLKSYVEKTCFYMYEDIYNAPVKFYAFVLISFAFPVLVSMIYWLAVSSRVDKAENIYNLPGHDETQTGVINDNKQARMDRNNDSGRKTFYVFYFYVFHLVLRAVLGILFASLQYTVLYPNGFDSQFHCVYPALKGFHHNSNAAKNDGVNLANATCHNSTASHKRFWGRIVCACNGIFAIIVLAEVIYLIQQRFPLLSRKSNAPWSCDSDFILRYLHGKQNGKQYEQVEVTFTGVANSAPKSSDIYKERVLKAPLTPDINYAVNTSLDEMFVDVVIQTGQAPHKFEKGMERHEIYDVYMKVPKHSIPITQSKDLFLPNTDTKGNTPRIILALGRPGIGKTVLTRKVMRDWAKGNDDFYQGKIAFYYKFKWFRFEKFKDLNLKTFLWLGTSLNESEFESVYEEIQTDPKKALFIFDGLDEAGRNVPEFENFLDRADCTTTMSAMSIFIKIAFGYWLSESTIFITSRPTAIDFSSKLLLDRTVEIIGFTLEKIEEYVVKFCAKDNQTDLKPKIWSHITSLSEVRNLCYIPVNCFIVCVTLSHCLNNPSNDNILPTTITELYTKALVYFNKHHDRNKNKECDEMTIKELQYLAFCGMENDQLVFNEECVNEQIKDFGLLNCLFQPIFTIQAQFCFIHLTIQEFLAARHIVETKDLEDIKEFISSHFIIGKWHLVLQFLAGLLGTRMKFDHVLDLTKHLTNYLDEEPCFLGFRTMLIMKWLREVKNEDIVKEAIANSPLKDITTIYPPDVLSSSDWAAVALVCKHLNCLADLHLRNIERDRLRELTNLLKVRCIRELSLSPNCNLGNDGIFQVLHARMEAKCNLSHEHFKLTHLDLTRNSIGDDGVSCISEFLKKGHGSSLKELMLIKNKITSRGISRLCEGLSENVDCRLTRLHLGANDIGDEGVRILCKTLIERPFELKALGLSLCSLTSECIEALCEFLSNEHCKVTELKLDKNAIGDEGVRMMSGVLVKKHCKLTVLNLSRCDFTKECMGSLRAALGDEHCRLTDLNLSDNDIRDKDASKLFDVLSKEQCKLTVLNLSECSLTDECLPSLCRALGDNHFSLTRLDMSLNLFTDKHLELLSDTLKQGCRTSVFFEGIPKLIDLKKLKHNRFT